MFACERIGEAFRCQSAEVEPVLHEENRPPVLARRIDRMCFEDRHGHPARRLQAVVVVVVAGSGRGDHHGSDQLRVPAGLAECAEHLVRVMQAVALTFQRKQVEGGNGTVIKARAAIDPHVTQARDGPQFGQIVAYDVDHGRQPFFEVDAVAFHRSGPSLQQRGPMRHSRPDIAHDGLLPRGGHVEAPRRQSLHG